jgi:peptidoglycan/xylan/chitin deacetylase (PgdA/CDA1 family)
MNILMLHDIREFNPDYFPERYKLPYFLVPKQFEKIIFNLNKLNANILRFKEHLIINEDSVKKSKTVLTFDDGLKDHITIARQLYKLNIKACFFIPSGPILELSMIDSHKIQFILASANPDQLVSEIKSEFEKKFNITSEALDSYFLSRWADNIWPKQMVFVTRVLREYPDCYWKRSLLDTLFFKFVSSDIQSFSSDFYLSMNDVLEINSLGHIIGGHGHHSYDLRFEDENTIETEIFRSSQFIDMFSQDQKIYAYANGGFNYFAKNSIQKNKFTHAFTTGHRSVVLGDENFEIPRIDATKTNLIN